MIEIRIPKEIREYKEKIMLGMTLKQVISIGIMAAVNIPLYFMLNPLLGMEVTSFVIMLTAAPIGAWGFVKIGGIAHYLPRFRAYLWPDLSTPCLVFFIQFKTLALLKHIALPTPRPLTPE